MTRLGIVAGGGDLPRRLVERCREGGENPFVIAFHGITHPTSVESVEHAWVRLGDGNEAVQRLHDAGVRDLVMIGPVRRPGLADLLPDRRTLAFLSKAVLKGWGDDGILSRIIRILEEEEGFRVRGVDEFLGELLVEPGSLGKIAPDLSVRPDIEKGIEVARRLGDLDIGQGVIIREGVVVAVEAAEGTDAMIERAGSMAPAVTSGVLVKLRKIGQERRVDLPAIGPRTIELLAAARLAGVVCEAGQTLVVDREKVAEQADALGLFVEAIPALP